jgi:Insulinase (Peptidase family M16)
VHDAKTDKASAAMDVNVGYFNDPEQLPGLAHCLEHMGTKKVGCCTTDLDRKLTDSSILKKTIFSNVSPQTLEIDKHPLQRLPRITSSILPQNLLKMPCFRHYTVP